MKTRQLFSVTGGIALGAAGTMAIAYRHDLKAARHRVESRRQVLDTPKGPIEFAESGNGPAVFVIHGAGGGFDQGLDLGRAFLGDAHRIVAPSRFGYLGTPLPEDATSIAQAEAHLRLLDALKLERVPVIGVSAGGPSALQLALRHPERCSALVLAVPLAYAPKPASEAASSPFRELLLNFITASDFLYWMATRVAHATMVQTILGTPIEDYESGTPAERKFVDDTLRNVLPISRRGIGIWNDGVVAATLAPLELEELRLPTLILTTADDLYGTYENSLYTADRIPGAKLVAFPTGGHLIVGHNAEVRSHIKGFIDDALAGAPKHETEAEPALV